MVDSDPEPFGIVLLDKACRDQRALGLVRVGDQNIEIAEHARAIRIAVRQLRSFDDQNGSVARRPDAIKENGCRQRRDARRALLMKQETWDRPALLLEHVCR